MGDLLVEMTDISKSFPGVQALDDARFELRAGRGPRAGRRERRRQVHPDEDPVRASTGATPGRSGQGRRRSRSPAPAAAQDLGISIIHQELNLMAHLTVAQNIFIGREPRRGLRSSTRRRSTRKAAELLERARPRPRPARARVGDLAVAQQQMVEIAKALSFNADVLIMDEPTAALTDTEIDELFRIIRHLRERGRGHRLHLAPPGGAQADRRPGHGHARRPLHRHGRHRRGRASSRSSA